MGNVVRLVSKPDLERARLIREARAVYEEIFPTGDAAGELQNSPAGGASKGSADS